MNLFAERSCSLGNCHSAATLLARPFSEPTATSRNLTEDIVCHISAVLCVNAVAVVVVINGVFSLSLQKLQCKDENTDKCSLNLQNKIAKTCSWTVGEALQPVIASPSWFESAFGAGSRRCGGRAVKEKVAISGVKTSEGPERN